MQQVTIEMATMLENAFIYNLYKEKVFISIWLVESKKG